MLAATKEFVLAENPIAQKLHLQAGQHVAIINAPVGYPDLLVGLPPSIHIAYSLKGQFEVVQVFVRNKAEADSYAPAAIRATCSGGVVWMAYPTFKTDLTRKCGWETLKNAGWLPTEHMMLNDSWSAIRFQRKV